jgi:hypothetical protein
MPRDDGGTNHSECCLQCSCHYRAVNTSLNDGNNNFIFPLKQRSSSCINKQMGWIGQYEHRYRRSYAKAATPSGEWSDIIPIITLECLGIEYPFTTFRRRIRNFIQRSS